MLGIEPKLNKLAKTTGVVVHEGLGIAKRLQKRVELHDLLFKTSTTRVTTALGAQVNDLLDKELGRFGFASTRLAGNNADLQTMSKNVKYVRANLVRGFPRRISAHCCESGVRDSKDVRGLAGAISDCIVNN